MVSYTCERCGKNFIKKSHFIVHTKEKKRPCGDTEKKARVAPKIFFVAPKIAPNEQDDNLSNLNSYSDFNDDSELNNNIKSNINNCILCGKNFTRTSSLKRHLTTRCKKTKEIKENIKENNKEQSPEMNKDILKDILKDVKEENKVKEVKNIDDLDIKESNDNDELTKALIKQQEQIANLTKIIMTLKEEKNNSLNNTINNCIINNKNTNNINNQVNNQLNNNITTNNIKIEFGKEDLSKISNDFFIKTLLNSSGALIPSKIIEGIHFNPELKEFMNVFISDFSRNKAMIYDGKNWNIANADEIVNTLFDKAIIFCEDRNEELYDKIQKNDKIKKKINKEMHVMNIMSNNEPYEFNEYKEPIDIDGNVLILSELKRGKSLNGKAKEHLKKSLYNKKTIIEK